MEVVDWNKIRFFWDLAQAACLVILTVYVWYSNRYKARGEVIDEMNKRIEGLDKHVGRLEHTMENQPGYTEIEHLRGEIQQTNRSLEKVSAELHSTTALLNRLHEYLLTERQQR